METLTIHIGRADVWEEVAKTAAYTGDKLTDADEGAYERILVTDDDIETLQRFWEETAAMANEALKEMLENSGPLSGDYDATLRVSRSYDRALDESVRVALQGYFVSAITARWFKLANKGEADAYLAESAGMMEEALRKLYHRKRPVRPARR